MNSTLWIFGHSVCLPYNLKNKAQAWPDIVSNQLNINCINLAQAASDNFFIYQCYLHHLPQIGPDDIVIISWSHYSRKSFVLNHDNPIQMAIVNQGMRYQTGKHEFIRGSNTSLNDANKWVNMKPVNRGVPYYDHWFQNYYSEYEQRCNFQSYFDSVQLTCPGIYLPFFLNKESVQNINISNIPNAGYMAEFILDNQVMISLEDMHLNTLGHQLWANHIIKCLDLVI